MKGDKRNLSNIGLNGRIRQILILAIAILVGVIISCAAKGQDFHKAKKRHFRAKYSTQIGLEKKVCHILNKKRNVRHKAPFFAVRHSKPKYKPQAEVDAPETHTPKFRRVDPVLANNN